MLEKCIGKGIVGIDTGRAVEMKKHILYVGRHDSLGLHQKDKYVEEF